MKEQLISFETAKLAKEKGFIEEVRTYYNVCVTHPKRKPFLETESDLTDNYNSEEYENARFIDSEIGVKYTFISAPTQSLLQKWLRDREENIIIVIPRRDFHRNYNGWYYEVFTQLTKRDKPVLIISSNENFDTYEEALEKGLQEALKLI